MVKRVLALLTLIPLIGACTAGSQSQEKPLTDLQITALNGYKCMIKEGLITKGDAIVLAQTAAGKDAEFGQPILSALKEGVSENDYERSEADIKESQGCKNVSLAWMAANLSSEKAAQIVADLQAKGWFDDPDVKKP